MPMASVMMWMPAWENLMPVASAMAREKCMNVGVSTSQQAIAIATEMSWTLWACVAAIARKILMPMASVTMLTIALVHSTPAESATALERSTSADVLTFLPVTVIVTETNWTHLACARAIVPKMRMRMGCVTRRKMVLALT